MTTLPDPQDRPALVWRFTPAVPMIALLIACACAAGDIYGHPALQPRIAMLIIGVVALGVAVSTLRMALVVDDDGIAVRSLLSAQWISWSEVQSIGLTVVRGSDTIIIIRVNDTEVVVPPSLLQPVWPTSKPRATARLHIFVGQITAAGQRSR